MQLSHSFIPNARSKNFCQRLQGVTYSLQDEFIDDAPNDMRLRPNDNANASKDCHWRLTKLLKR